MQNKKCDRDFGNAASRGRGVLDRKTAGTINTVLSHHGDRRGGAVARMGGRVGGLRCINETTYLKLLNREKRPETGDRIF